MNTSPLSLLEEASRKLDQVFPQLASYCKNREDLKQRKIKLITTLCRIAYFLGFDSRSKAFTWRPAKQSRSPFCYITLHALFYEDFLSFRLQTDPRNRSRAENPGFLAKDEYEREFFDFCESLLKNITTFLVLHPQTEIPQLTELEQKLSTLNI